MPPARHVDELGCANDCVDGAGQFIDRASTDTEEFDVAHIGPSPSAFATLRKRRHLLGDDEVGSSCRPTAQPNARRLISAVAHLVLQLVKTGSHKGLEEFP
jgi:hypothetical protein